MLGEKLRIALSNSSFTQDDFAEKMEISKSNLHNLFKKDSFDVSYVIKASKLLEVPVSYFLEGADFPVGGGPEKNETSVSTYLKEIEERFEKRYEKIISHYEALLKRYESGNVNFRKLSKGSPVQKVFKGLEIIIGDKKPTKESALIA